MVLPLTLVLVLLMRMNGIMMALQMQPHNELQKEPIYFDNDYDTTNYNDFDLTVGKTVTEPQDAAGLSEEERIKRCVSFKFGLSETIDLDERDFMRDARTSFLPQDTTAIPRECLETSSYGNQFGHAKDDDQLDEIYRKRLRRTSDDANKKDKSKYYSFYDAALEKMLALADSMGVKDYAGETDDPIPDSSDIAGLIETSSLQSFWNEQGTRENIRETQARTMKRYMDNTVDPCTDFYRYACGNWPKLHPIPRDKAGFDTFEMLRENLDVVLKQLLETNDVVGANPQATKISPIQDNNFDILNADKKSDIVSTPAHLRGTKLRRSTRSAPKPFDTDSARLCRNIVSKRDVLNSILQRYKRQSTNTQRKRLIALYNKRSGNSPIVKLQAGTHTNIKPPIKDDKNDNAQRKARYLYQSCTNAELLKKRGIQPLLQLINQFGGWPVLNPQWNGQSFDWLNLTAQLRRYNNDILLVEWVGPDIKNSDENVIQFDQTSLGLPTREYFLQESNAKYLHAYQRFMAEVMQRLGAPQEVSLKTAAELIAFETQLASITSPADQRLNVTKLYRRMTINQLHKTVPEINWLRYLTILQQRDVDDSEQVVIYAVKYMKDLVRLLRQTPRRTVSNYLHWRFVRHRINNVDDRFEDIKQNFYHTLFGREESPSRWKVCIAQVNTNMGMALGSMFVRKYFDENSKRDTLRMTHELQQAFREILNRTDWLDPETKYLAERKVNAMSLKIGYPDFILKPAELNEKYAGIDIQPDKYFENTLNVLLHTSRTEQNKLHESVNKTTWQTAPAIVNAYYSRNKNQIMFPAGILQPPFYHRHFPRSLNFGGIGVVIGHELTHGFDDKGRLFDQNGSIHKWWSDSAVRGFDERARCIIAQYSNYTVHEVGIALNGESTQGENIADNGGLRQAFHAYKRWLYDNPLGNRDERLPGLNMTGEQLFFLNFGQVWCGAMRPEAVRNKLNTAIHSPGRYRVIGTLSNSKDFAREFRCAEGTPMNPTHKCSVW